MKLPAALRGLAFLVQGDGFDPEALVPGKGGVGWVAAGQAAEFEAGGGEELVEPILRQGRERADFGL